MKTLSLIPVLLLGLAAPAHGETTGKTRREATKEGRTVPRKAAPKDDSPSPKKADKADADDDDIPDKPKAGHTKSTTPTTHIEDAVTEGPVPPGVKREAAVSSIEPEELANFENYAPQIQQLVRNALDLTKLNLTYTFGSADPGQGGMDCSGTIVYLLNGLGMKGVPRQSDEICGWVQDRTLLHKITTADSLKHPEFAALQPGDLLFWSGTYTTAPRKIPVTHVMIYLGKLKKTGKHVVFGASDGRVYQGERRTGVSVFDFSLPRVGSTATFYGYGLIPAIGKVAVKIPAPATPETNVTEAPKTAPPKEPAVAKLEPKAPPIEEKEEPVVTKKVPAKTKTSPSAKTKNDEEASTAAVREKISADEKQALASKKEPAATRSSSPTEDSPTPVNEEVRRAIPAVATSKPDKTDETPAARPKSTVAKSDSNTKSSKTGTNGSRSTTRKRTPPRELTAKEKIENTANRFANSVKSAFSN